ncbi:LOW QUALITY PROTEIN: 5-hydroxytryptamine receptor 3C-like [Megaptera novaeangliae]
MNNENENREAPAWQQRPSLTGSLLSTGRGDTFTINCSGLSQHGVDPAAFQAVFDRKAFRPVTNFSIPTHVHISFTLSAILDVLQLLTSFLWITMMWDNLFISWNPEEYVSNNKLTASAENLWLPDIINEFVDVDRGPPGLTACVSSEGRIQYDRPMKVTSTCNLDIFYFLFDQLNCTFTFSSLLYTVDSMLLGMDKELWVITDTSRNVILSQGEWQLLNIDKATTLVDSNLYDQIMFSVTIRRRPSLYVINLLVPSSFLIAIDALSFYLPAESESYAPFKMTLLLGYNIFLLMTLNDLLPASGTSLISVYFALCLSLMVLRLLETIFITYLLHLATTQPPPRPRWLRSLLLHCTSPRKRCPAAPQKGNTGLGLSPAHLPGEGNQHCPREPVELVGKVPGPREAELNGCPGSARAQQEDEAQKQHSVSLWLQLSHMTDTLLFRLCLLFPAPSVVTVIILWDT